MFRPIGLITILALFLSACQAPAVTPSPSPVLPTEPAAENPTTPSLTISETRIPTARPTPTSDVAAIVMKQDPQAAQTAVLIPLTMYYLERHFLDLPNKTDFDMNISQLINEYPDSEPIFRHAYDNYSAMDIDERMAAYDPLTVRLTADTDKRLDLDKIRGQLEPINPNLVVKDANAPVAASSLMATNASFIADPDTTSSDNFRIRLDWQDNSHNEHGFLIYRFFPLSLAGVKAQQIASVGADITEYTDILHTPVKTNDQYCYYVVAYRKNPITIVGQPQPLLESGPSNTSCSLFAPQPPPPLPDGDQDGWPDQVDKCPTIHDEGAYWTQGCPDDDEDGIDNITDQCKQKWGDLPSPSDTAPKPEPGCPILYTLRWMKIEVLNNSIHSVDSQGVYRYNEVSDTYPPGEEPYLIFSFVNGALHGVPLAYTSRWCCGEEINIQNGKKDEPDNDFSGEEVPAGGPEIIKAGLQIFPGLSAVKSDELDRQIGLTMAVSLLERDWTMLITPEKQASALEGVFKMGSAVAGSVATCIGSGGFGCLASIGSALKSIIEGILDLSNEPAPVEVKDPDDFMGTDTWSITRADAKQLTADDGAYGFWFEMPTTFYGACWGIPCYVSSTSPATMRARVYFCLSRDGVPSNQLHQLCSPYVQNYP